MTEEQISLALSTIEAADRFFREAMPKLNVRDSAIDADGIDAWNKAEIAISKAMREFNLPREK